MIKETLELIEAEREYLKATQDMIVEEIDWFFCEDIYEKVLEGMPPSVALESTVEEYGYHFKNDT